MKVPDPQGTGDGVELAAKLWTCKLLLPRGECSRGIGWTAIPRFTKLLWCLFYISASETKQNTTRRKKLLDALCSEILDLLMKLSKIAESSLN